MASIIHSTDARSSISSIPRSISSTSHPQQQDSLASCISSFPPSTSSNQNHKGSIARRGLSVLSQLPKDLSSLFRSNSASGHPLQGRHDESQAVFRLPPQSGYAEQPSMSTLQTTAQLQEMSSARDEERPSRKNSRSENRLYNFLTRSRSRSRSKADRSASVDNPPIIPELPETGSSHGRHFSLGQIQAKSSTPSSSRPATRGHSRPLSSTTTATNTTITPGTPRPKKRMSSSIPVPIVPPPPITSRPTTPKPSTTRKKLHNLFGIPFSGQRKSPAASRPTSPIILPIDARGLPPLPTDLSLEHETPKPRKSHSPHPPSRSHSPLPSFRPRHEHKDSTGSNATNTSTSTSNSSRLDSFFRSPKLFALQPQPPNKSPVSSTIPLAAVSLPLKRTPSTQHRQSDHPKNTATQDGLVGAQERGVSLQRTSSPTIQPKSLPRPATSPVRSAVRRDLTSNAPRRPLDAPITVLNDDRSGGGTTEFGAVRKGKEREPSLNRRVGLLSGNNGRSTKHGSFDFEKPGWSGIVARSNSGGTTATATSGDSMGITPLTLRESLAMSVGAGMAGVGTLQREVSLKRVEEEREKAKSKVVGGKKKPQKHVSLQITPVDMEASTDIANNSTSTTRTNGTGKSSSWGRGAGKRLLFGLSHGPFAFEPPVPSPTRANGVSPSDQKPSEFDSRERERLQEERQREKERKARTGDRAAVPVPKPPTLHTNGYRSGQKGRSLDLGLGLAWAPSKVREDALLPSATFFSRSASGTSSGGAKSATGSLSSNHGHGRSGSGSKRGHGEELNAWSEEDRSRVGKEVAEVFQNALDAKGYTAFKEYVHQFDADAIPFDGPTGIVARVQRLLETAPDLSEDGKRRLLDSFVRIILQNA